ncbi:CheR family methyltransferase [Methanolobus sp.]|uniref:CheR family methyltransferase n=1 Tax=Methanolobus sp. TaxID=1874737 RepID=UPI0026010405|nr:CheR family methyltransferase [Methanolobus sp.]
MSENKKRTQKEGQLQKEVKADPKNEPFQGPDANSSFGNKFPVVGIGASAGGLEAFENFFTAIPKDINIGMAFVLVQHLKPDNESMLPEIIGRYTNMEVNEVQDGMSVKSDCVYVIPPNKNMIITEGVLHLTEPTEDRGHRMPIDSFLMSLALDQQELGIGIILSGLGNDGTHGIKAIKTNGGMAMVQSPESSEYNSMPQNAIETGLVDYILEPFGMPAQLIEYKSQMFGELSDSPDDTEEAMKNIFSTLLNQTGHDFSRYKPQTLNRRIMRRMIVNNIKHIDTYANYLQQKPEEVGALFRDLLISVTNFFRNSKVFDTLQEKVLPHLFDGRVPKAPVRVWVAGCSTGEEAYSIAILLQEHMEKLEQNFKIQIFATDIDSRNIKKARKGVYPASISKDVSPERLKHFFIYDSEEKAYAIRKDIRSMVIFSEHDVIRDPPFSKIDLISCRNLLIYMNKELQDDLIPKLHYALNPGRFLLLGTSESIRDFSDFFNTLDSQSKIYETKIVSSEYLPVTGTSFPSSSMTAVYRHPAKKAPVKNRVQMREVTERKLLQRYAPASALVDEHGEILYLHGRTGPYLEMSPGEPQLNILKMSREGLHQQLTRAFRKAVIGKIQQVASGLRVKTNGDFTTVNLTVEPVEEITDRKLFLITFDVPPEPNDEQEEHSESSRCVATDINEDAETVLALKEELQTTEEYLKASNEDLEISNEGLKASNEELQSLNEEFQSTNEELETSREELESLNEELSTVNVELQNKVEKLSNFNDEMNDLLASTEIGLIFVDNDLLIQRFTPAATKMINLFPTDVGRPIGHFVTNLSDHDRLNKDIRQVLDTLDPVYMEAHINSGEWYMLNIRPYCSRTKSIEGAVITFMEITQLKQLQEKQTNTLRHLAAVVNDSRDAILLQDIEGKILAWNPMAEKIYGWSAEEALNMNVSDLVPVDKKEESKVTLKKLAKSETIEPYRTKRLTKDGHTIDVYLMVTALINESGDVYAIATTERGENSNALL